MSPFNALAINGVPFIAAPVDLHFELVDPSLPTVHDLDQLTFYGVEYRNTADIDGDSLLSMGDTSTIDGVFVVTSFLSNGSIILGTGLNSTWEMTGTFVAIKDIFLPIVLSGSIPYYSEPGIGILTLYVSTDMTKRASTGTGLGFDDGTVVARFAVTIGGGIFKIISPLDGSRDYSMTKQSALSGFFEPEINGANFDANLDADPNNNGIGGDAPVPTAWKYPTAIPAVNFPWAYFSEIDGSLRFGYLAKKSGCKFDDQDGDGIWDPDEPGAPGWTIHLTGTDFAGNPVSTSAVTGSDGCYEFTVPFGTYKVCEEFQAGWTQTFPTGPAGGEIINCDDPDVPGDGWGYLVTLNANNPIDEGNNFGNYKEMVIGGCRMTGGHNKFESDMCVVEPPDAETYQVSTVTVKRGSKTVTQEVVTRYTLGGQIGAPEAACLSEPDTAFGDWQHVHHEGPVSWPASSQGSYSWAGGTFTGGFAFHSGTAAAPDQAYIKCITCADPGWCVQARCAPFKQIFWEGTGVFHNIDRGTTFPNCSNVRVWDKKAAGTIHYYRAHVGDFGEPAGCTDNQNPANQCGWTSAGPSLLNGVLDGVTILPWPLDLKFGDKGGQDCSAYDGCTKCGSCPDWYEIEIHCTADPGSPIIYKVGNFITHGNHQIHPEVGEHCPY